MSTRKVEVRAKVLKQNDLLARSLREQFQACGVCVAGLVSSPSSGKTAFLEKLLAGLSVEFRVAALVGDLATENDAARLRRATPNVKQITTGNVCHLDAQMVASALDSWRLDAIDFLFIENVGNLVCPSSYDLGEELRFVLLSATEGEDKPLKFPTIFNSSDVAIITKMDLAVPQSLMSQRLAGILRACGPEYRSSRSPPRPGPACRRSLTCCVLNTCVLRVRVSNCNQSKTVAPCPTLGLADPRRCARVSIPLG